MRPTGIRVNRFLLFAFRYCVFLKSHMVSIFLLRLKVPQCLVEDIFVVCVHSYFKMVKLKCNKKRKVLSCFPACRCWNNVYNENESCFVLISMTRCLCLCVPLVLMSRISCSLWVPSHFPLSTVDHKSPHPPTLFGSSKRRRDSKTSRANVGRVER